MEDLTHPAAPASPPVIADPGPSRIPYPAPGTLSPAKYERMFGAGQRRLLNVSHMAMHASERLWAAHAALGRATIETDLDPRLREMVILRVARLEQSDYELFHHRGLAVAAGVSVAEVTAILDDDLSVLSPLDRALIAFVDAVVLDGAPDDALLAALRRHHPDRFVFDMVILIGSYMMTARIVAVGGIAPEDEPVRGW